jgi:hypothetical protein
MPAQMWTPMVESAPLGLLPRADRTPVAKTRHACRIQLADRRCGEVDFDEVERVAARRPGSYDVRYSGDLNVRGLVTSGADAIFRMFPQVCL